MNIAILGGSFDPPHRGHLAIANRLLKLNYFDQVWFMPCHEHPFNKDISPANKRFEMVKYLENDFIMISDLEIKREKISYSIDTLNFLAKKHPNDKFSWIIGTDQIKDFIKWKNWKEIIDGFRLIIIPRAGFRKGLLELKSISEQVVNPKNIILIDKKKFPPIYISSKLIRQRIEEGKSISNLVPKKIEEYTIRNKLYK